MNPADSDQLAEHFVSFIHSFGMLRSDTTPCGRQMSVSTAHALCELATGPTLNQRDLAARLGLTTSSTSRLVDQLVAKDWARRESDPEGSDTRVRLVVLTADGERTAQLVLQARQDRFARLLGHVPAEKRTLVVEALSLLKEASNAID